MSLGPRWQKRSGAGRASCWVCVARAAGKITRKLLLLGLHHRLFGRSTCKALAQQLLLSEWRFVAVSAPSEPSTHLPKSVVRWPPARRSAAPPPVRSGHKVHHQHCRAVALRGGGVREDPAAVPPHLRVAVRTDAEVVDDDDEQVGPARRRRWGRGAGQRGNLKQAQHCLCGPGGDDSEGRRSSGTS